MRTKNNNKRKRKIRASALKSIATSHLPHWTPWQISILPWQAAFKCMVMTSLRAWCCLLMHNNDFLSLQNACMLACVNGHGCIWERGYKLFPSQFTAHVNCLQREALRVKWENEKSKIKLPQNKHNVKNVKERDWHVLYKAQTTIPHKIEMSFFFKFSLTT